MLEHGIPKPPRKSEADPSNKRMSQDTFAQAVFTGSPDLLAWVFRFLSILVQSLRTAWQYPKSLIWCIFLVTSPPQSGTHSFWPWLPWLLPFPDSSWRLACFLLPLLLRSTVFRLWTGSAGFLCAAIADYCFALYALINFFWQHFSQSFQEGRTSQRHSSS